MAKQSAPGKFYRQGIGLPKLFQLFPDDATAEEWFIANRWPDGLRCAHCESPNAEREGNHPQRPFPCRDCRKFFSVKTGTVMQSSKLGYQKWALAIYILTTSIKGTSRMKLRGIWAYPKDGVALGSPHPPVLAGAEGFFPGARGIRRNLHRRERGQQTRRQKVAGWPRNRRQNGGGGGERLLD